jgi:hypothetical protein
MDKPIELIVKQIEDIKDIVNGFQSEAVQIRIVESLLPFVGLKNKQTKNVADQSEASITSPTILSRPRIKRQGVKRVLDQVMLTDFFTNERTISDVVQHLNDAGNNFKTTEVSGILLAFIREGRLRRYHSPVNNRFLYIQS